MRERRWRHSTGRTSLHCIELTQLLCCDLTQLLDLRDELHMLLLVMGYLCLSLTQPPPILRIVNHRCTHPLMMVLQLSGGWHGSHVGHRLWQRLSTSVDGTHAAM